MNDKLQAVILAAGIGERCWPLTLTTPKPMLKIANKPILWHKLEQFAKLVDEVIIVVGRDGKIIADYFGKSYKNLKLIYVEQKDLPGTWGALYCAKELVKEKFIVAYGDDFYSIKDIKKCLKHNKSILTKKVTDTSGKGVILTDGALVKKIIEKPKEQLSHLVNTGNYVLDKSVFKIRPKTSERNEYEITTLLDELANKSELFCEIASENYFSVTYPWDLLNANELILKQLKISTKCHAEKGVTIKGFVKIGKNTVLKAGTYIEGPAVVGDNCELGPNCHIRPYTSIGNNCKIGNFVEIKNSIIGDGTKIPHFAYIGDSIIGNNVNIGVNTYITNLRVDGTNVQSAVNGKLIDTKRRKFGAVIGDNAQTCGSTTIWPGRKIWPGKIAGPGLIKEDVI